MIFFRGVEHEIPKPFSRDLRHGCSNRRKFHNISQLFQNRQYEIITPAKTKTKISAPGIKAVNVPTTKIVVWISYEIPLPNLIITLTGEVCESNVVAGFSTGSLTGPGCATPEEAVERVPPACLCLMVHTSVNDDCPDGKKRKISSTSGPVILTYRPCRPSWRN